MPTFAFYKLHWSSQITRINHKNSSPKAPINFHPEKPSLVAAIKIKRFDFLRSYFLIDMVGLFARYIRKRRTWHSINSLFQFLIFHSISLPNTNIFRLSSPWKPFFDFESFQSFGVQLTPSPVSHSPPQSSWYQHSEHQWAENLIGFPLPRSADESYGLAYHSVFHFVTRILLIERRAMKRSGSRASF